MFYSCFAVPGDPKGPLEGTGGDLGGLWDAQRGPKGASGAPERALRGPRGGLEEAQGGPKGAMRSPSGVPGERLGPLRASEKSLKMHVFFIVFLRYGGLEGTPGTPLGAAMGCLE